MKQWQHDELKALIEGWAEKLGLSTQNLELKNLNGSGVWEGKCGVRNKQGQFIGTVYFPIFDGTDNLDKLIPLEFIRSMPDKA